MIVFVFLLATFVAPSLQHGRLIGPPSRSTAWRYGFDVPPNYNDNELNCGGYAVSGSGWFLLMNSDNLIILFKTHYSR